MTAVQILNYIVENAQIVNLQKQVDFEGQSATVHYDRALIEALPADGSGATFTMNLPPEALGEFPEGASITVTVEGV